MPSKSRLLMVWLYAACALSAQTSAARAKQKAAAPPAAAKEGLYILRGRVIATGIEQPVDSALITFTSNMKYTDDVFSNTKGEFEIELPPGDYTYEAKVYGYELDNDAYKGFTIAAGKKVESLTVRMLRGAEISGIVEDADGRPLADVRVDAASTLTATLSRAGRTRADGTFSIPSVLPGPYMIRAVMVTPEPDAASTFVTTYYPDNTTDSFAAKEVTVLGADLPNLRLRMQRADVHYVGGKVTGDANLIAKSTVSLRAIEDPRPMASLQVGTLLDRIPQRSSKIGEDGTFSFDGIPPGRYIATVLANPLGFPLAASEEFTVRDRDVDDLRVAVTPGGVFAGKFVSENGKLPKDMDGTYLTGQVAAGRVGSTMKVAKDGSFSVEGVPNGTYALAVNAQTGYSVSSVDVGGHKYEGGRFPFAVPGSKEVVVTLSSGGALIQGTLAGSVNPSQPVKGTVTAVMQSGLTNGLPYMRKATLAPNGSFTVIDLEVGTYLVCAWSDYSLRVDRLLNSERPPVGTLQHVCKTVDLKKGGAESIEVGLTSLAEVTR